MCVAVVRRAMWLGLLVLFLPALNALILAPQPLQHGLRQTACWTPRCGRARCSAWPADATFAECVSGVASLEKAEARALRMGALRRLTALSALSALQRLALLKESMKQKPAEEAVSRWANDCTEQRCSRGHHQPPPTPRRSAARPPMTAARRPPQVFRGGARPATRRAGRRARGVRRRACLGCSRAAIRQVAITHMDLAMRVHGWWRWTRRLRRCGTHRSALLNCEGALPSFRGLCRCSLNATSPHFTHFRHFHFQQC